MRQIIIWWMEEVVQSHGKPWLFQQDSATAQWAVATHTLPEDADIPVWPRKMWPTSSPDLAPLDYGLWEHVKRVACARRSANFEELKHHVNATRHNLDGDLVRRVFSSFRRRLQKCVDAEGLVIQYINSTYIATYVVPNMLYFSPVLIFTYIDSNIINARATRVLVHPVL